uniref:MFS transporter n=1 Tax=Eiseniibacteriota bacterium TaxID=2212470 RepID=A0A832I2R3_UNCEI
MSTVAVPEEASRAVPPAPGARGAAPAGPAEVRRNYRLGVLNGALYQAGEGFIDAHTVIPVFLARLTESRALIGLGSSLVEIGWLAPQFAVAPWVARRPRQLAVYRRAAVVRAGALGLFAALLWPLMAHPAALLAAFFLLYGAYCLGAGFGALSFMEVVGRTIPRERLGAFWSSRLFWGGSLVALAGLAVREVLRIPDLALRYGLLFGAATVVVSVAYALFSAVREPVCPPGESVNGPLEVLRDGWRQLTGDRTFRRLLVARSSGAAWLTLGPFLVLFAAHDLGGGAKVAGTFLLARVAGFVLANLAWPRLSASRGSRGIMRVSTFGTGAVAVACAAVAVFSPWGLGWIGRSAAIVALESLAFVGGAMQSGMMVAYGSLLLELAPGGRRQLFVAQMNTFLGPSMLLPALGGALVDWFNAPVVFGLCALLAWTGHRAATGLPDQRGVPPEALSEECGCG